MTHEPLGASGARGWRLPALVLLNLALLAALVVLGIRAWDARDVAAPPAGGYGSTAVRDEVIATTEQFALRVNTFGPKDLDEAKHLTAYKERVGELLTTKFRTGFEQTLEIPEQVVAQRDYSISADVKGAGVASVSADRAVTLVAWQADARYGAEESTPLAGRWKVTLLKVKGKWLVDNYENVTGETP